MTTQRMIFDLRPIPKIVSVLEAQTEPSLAMRAEEAQAMADTMLGDAPREDVRPASAADLAELEGLLELSPAEVADLHLQAYRDVMDFLGQVRKYFSAVHSIREFTNDEKAALAEFGNLLNNIAERMLPEDFRANRGKIQSSQADKGHR